MSMNPQRLTALRLARHWTQAELARQANIQPAHVNQLESGRKDNPTWETLDKLATAFDMSLAELVAALDADPTPAGKAA
jgi:transcriptional regulator with XRE-family HTH domain